MPWTVSCLVAPGRDHLQRDLKSSAANLNQKSATKPSSRQVPTDEAHGKSSRHWSELASRRRPSHHVQVPQRFANRHSQGGEVGTFVERFHSCGWASDTRAQNLGVPGAASLAQSR